MQRKAVTIQNSVYLAPMAGITDLPFRNLVQSFGADLVTSEMVASQDMVNARAGTRDKAEIGFDEQNTAVQLAGRDAYWMGEAARIAEANGARIIDINMGCPAKKVTGGQSGSALMRNLELARSLIAAVVGAVSVPVTLKCRLGWDDQQRNAAELAHIAEAEYLEPARISQYGAIPTHKIMQITMGLYDRDAGTQHQMKGIAKQHTGTRGNNVPG